MNYILFDDPEIRQSLLPLTYTRPVSHIRTGIFTIAEKWQVYFKKTGFYETAHYLQEKFPGTSKENSVQINGAVCPTIDFFNAIQELEEGSALVQNDLILAYKGENITSKISFTSKEELTIIRYPWDIFINNGKEIRRDFEILRKKVKNHGISDPFTAAYNKEDIIIEEGAKIRAAVLNAESGPIYIGKNAEVQEGAVIRGPFALCENSVLNMGSKMRGDITIGPCSKVGGEVSNSVIFGYSNKGHDGFVGNTVIGEWCNLGAGTNSSNLKNNYGEVQVYSIKERGYINTNRQFCGLIMGDHSKAGISTMFNTGTVTGVCANIFGGGFQPKFIPSFSWGGSDEYDVYKFEKALETLEKVMERREIKLTKTDQKILEYIFKEREQEMPLSK